MYALLPTSPHFPRPPDLATTVSVTVSFVRLFVVDSLSDTMQPLLSPVWPYFIYHNDL